MQASRLTTGPTSGPLLFMLCKKLMTGVFGFGGADHTPQQTRGGNNRSSEKNTRRHPRLRLTIATEGLRAGLPPSDNTDARHVNRTHHDVSFGRTRGPRKKGCNRRVDEGQHTLTQPLRAVLGSTEGVYSLEGRRTRAAGEDRLAAWAERVHPSGSAYVLMRFVWRHMHHKKNTFAAYRTVLPLLGEAKPLPREGRTRHRQQPMPPIDPSLAFSLFTFGDLATKWRGYIFLNLESLISL